MSLEHLAVSESKEMLKKKKKQTNTTMMGASETRKPWEEPPRGFCEQNNGVYWIISLSVKEVVE